VDLVELGNQDNLNKIYEEMVEYIKSCGLRVFPTVSGQYNLDEEEPNVVIWDSARGDWKSFIEIAKEEGAKTIIVGVIKGRDDKHADDIGSIALAWIKDGVKYAFEEQTEWWVESTKEGAPSIGIGYRREGQISKEVMKDLQSKDENQLADEMLVFLSKEFPEPFITNYHSTEPFWEQKGINMWFLDPELRLKIEKVNTIVRQKFEQERLKKEKECIEKEKELLPKLVEECLEWAGKNHIKKVTKSNIDYFLTEKRIGINYPLTEKGIVLTRINRDAIYNEVNFKLQKK
jgi:hypothetical protein